MPAPATTTTTTTTTAVFEGLHRFFGVEPVAGLALADEARRRPSRGAVTLRLAPAVARAVGLPERALLFSPWLADALPAGEPLAFVADDWPERPAVVATRSGGVVFGFDLEAAIQATLEERGREPAPPLVGRLPFHYHRVPGLARLLLAKLLPRFGPVPPRDGAEEPEPAVAFHLDLFRHAAERALGRPLRPRPFWPAGTRYAVAFTHDVDTAESQANVPRLRAIEAAAGIPATFFFVTHGYPLDDALLRGLLAEGCEVGAHGWNHDGRLAFLPEEEMERRLAASADRLRACAPAGFRSPCLGRSRALLARIGRHFDHDSSVPTRAADGSGCETFFPFERDGTLELPVTLPMDADLVFAGIAPRDALNVWRRALARVKAAGGLAVLGTHPDPRFLGRPTWLDAYRDLLAEVVADPEAWVAPLGAVARWWRRRSAKGT